MINEDRKLIASSFTGILLGVLIAFHGIPGYAETLPTKGTFRGVYHVNRAGVGRFKFFIISKALKGQMALYEGKYVELEVLKARQPMNPGPAIIDHIGKVTRLPDPPLRLTLQAMSSTAKAGKTIDVVYSLVNAGEKEITVNANDLQVGVRGYSQTEQDDAQDDFFQTGYTRRQLSFGGTLLQRWNFVSPMTPGERTHFYTGKVLLRPGESAPFVLHGIELERGQYELAVVAAFYPTRDERVPVMAAKSLDWPLPQQKNVEGALLDAQAQVTDDDEWLVVDGHILGKPHANVSLFTLSDHGRHFLPGLVQLYSESGDLLPARLDWRQPDGPWRRTKVGRKGLPFKFRVRHADRFSRTSIMRIDFWTVTDRGIERLTLSDGLPESPQRPVPSWGKTVRGCRIRIQMSRESYKVGEKIRFFFQAESDGKKADMIWVDEGSFESHVVVTIDGNKARVGSTGISDGHVNRFPFQGEMSLASIYKVPPGKHTLQLSVRGDPGTYTNLRGEKFRKLKGTLLSNTVEFDVQREE